jgi:hypothetical protein
VTTVSTNWFNVQNPLFCPHSVFMGFVWFSHQRTIVFPPVFNRLVLTIYIQCFYLVYELKIANLSLCLISQATCLEDIWGSRGIAPFMISALDGGECSVSRPGSFTSVETAPGTHCLGDWKDPRAGMEAMKKRNSIALPGIETPLLVRPARSPCLYRLIYLDPLCMR